MKDELKICRTQLSTSEERSRRCHLELEVLRERGAANKVAERLRTVQGSSSPTPNSRANSHLERRGRDLYRDAFKASSSQASGRRASSTPVTTSSNRRSNQQRKLDRWVDADLDLTDDMSSKFESSQHLGFNHSKPPRNHPVTMEASDSDNNDHRDYPTKDLGGRAGSISSSEPELDPDTRHVSLMSRSRSAASSRSHKSRHTIDESDDGRMDDVSATVSAGEASHPFKRIESSRQTHSASLRSPAPDVSSSVDTADVLTPNAARLQYDRLQKMYQRVTGGRR